MPQIRIWNLPYIVRDSKGKRIGFIKWWKGIKVEYEYIMNQYKAGATIDEASERHVKKFFTIDYKDK